ncbi:PH domain-containing protein [Rathayibacter sp. VKM Ac-2760]|uniref:PH domain-containing protein n=1 Tax=Rathayibacter sp. VKM Ac-2760 TaxID=2609253 RepID=UPI0013179270|nr:PH domain-containing protein [Rathayibacter sp. VKM Ac-2760]QHC57658.1 PH domain-containing protein [Rathayibacter sp. VKM Ac-2760]
MADDQEPTPLAAAEPLSRRAAIAQEGGRRESSAEAERSAEPSAAPTADPAGTPTAEPAANRLDLAGPWHRVSPRYVAVEVVSAVVSSVVLLAVPTVLLLIGVEWAWILVAAAAVLAVTMLVVAPRRARAYGYRLREDDLLFRRGIMFQRFVSVPYGRMQLIDVNRGPLARALGLADLRFVTAAAATGVSIPGLVDGDAEELRDRLVQLAESRRAGL